MASNQNVNKVVYAGTTLIDLTGDDVTAGDVLSGKKFHLASGAAATGTMPNIGAISGILKGDGAGNVSAATAGTDYLAPPVLLWENQTPSAEITTKSISIQNLTGYSFLLIEFRLHSSAARSSYALIGTESNGIISGGQGYNYGSRMVNINNNTVEIAEFVSSRTEMSDQKLRLLPVKIFGVNL